MDLLFSWKFILLSSLIPVLIYAWFRRRYNYWHNRKVRGPQPTFIVGNIKDMLTKKLHLGIVFKNLYEETKNEPFVGVYMLHKPTLLVNNLDLIKMILVKDFIHFTDHGFQFNKETQPLVNHLFNINGAHWKGVRTKLTPAFTSSKVKYMFDTIAVYGKELTEYLEGFAVSGKEVDMKDAVAKFSTDVIVSCAFGVNGNSFKNPDAEFLKMGKKVFQFDFRQRIVMFMVTFMPELHKLFGGKLIEQSVSDFFIDAVEQVVKYREENNATRNDLLQLLIRLKNNENINDNAETTEAKENEKIDVQLSMIEMIAQAFGFFAAGFETTSITTSFILYLLAKHEDIQSKLRKEIDEVLQKHDGKLTYETLNDMTYMSQVIEETLRLYPPIPQLFRVCTKEYVIPHTTTVIEKGTSVIIPALGIHMDPKIYPNPEKFDPDRMSPEMKASRHHYSFLSFGEGPRICIGNRLAFLQLRIALVSILKHYEVSIGINKENTLKISNKSFLMTPTDMNLKISKRPIQ